MIVEDIPFLRRGAISGLRLPGKPSNEGTKANVAIHQFHLSIEQIAGNPTLSKPTPVRSDP